MEKIVLCDMMKDNFVEYGGPPETTFGSPDNLIGCFPKTNQYGIIVHDGGDSMIKINYCPRCGQKLPKSTHDMWIEYLRENGIDPSDEIPLMHQFDTWVKKE